MIYTLTVIDVILIHEMNIIIYITNEWAICIVKYPVPKKIRSFKKKTQTVSVENSIIDFT